MHIGSGPGVAGLSGMQVKLFVPLRKVRIFPSAPMATIVACFPTLAGAADSALAMSSASVGTALAAGGFAADSAGLSAADTAHVDTIRSAPIEKLIVEICFFIELVPSLMLVRLEAH